MFVYVILMLIVEYFCLVFLMRNYPRQVVKDFGLYILCISKHGLALP